MPDAADLYRQLRFDLVMEMGLLMEEAAPIAYEMVERVLSGETSGRLPFRHRALAVPVEPLPRLAPPGFDRISQGRAA